MGVNSLPKTVTRQRRGCDLNLGRSAPESSTLTTRLPSRLRTNCIWSPPTFATGFFLAGHCGKQTRGPIYKISYDNLRIILR